MPDTIDKKTFQGAYAQRPPWDIDGPQPAFRALRGKLSGSLLDAGCGSGEHALYFAAQGLTVTGIDFLDQPIAQARAKAAQRGVSATFRVKDALSLQLWPERFDNVLDSGLFHIFSDDDRAVYVKGLATVLKPGGRLYLLCFSDRTPGKQGPRRVTLAEIESAFGAAWLLESIEPATFECRPEFRDTLFGGVDPQGWFVIAQRAP